MAQDIIARQRLRLSAEKLQPKGPKNIYLHVTGQVQSGSFRGEEPLACTYDFSYGPDWRIQRAAKPVAKPANPWLQCDPRLDCLPPAAVAEPDPVFAEASIHAPKNGSD